MFKPDKPVTTPEGVRPDGLHDFNKSPLFSEIKAFHELVEYHAAVAPDKAALVSEEKTLTYGELNHQANRLAFYLKGLGVQPEVLVGLCLERSFAFFISVLAVMKAGGAYVPLDPSYPAGRLAFMVEDARVAVLITKKELQKLLPPNHTAKVVCVDRDGPQIARESSENPPLVVQPRHAAYVIYTSGSTGRPKGVLNLHKGVLNLARAQQQLFDLSEHTRVLQFASISFDASVWEMVMAFTARGQLCIGKPESMQPGTPLRDLLHNLAISHITLTPSVLELLPSGGLAHLKTIISAGEACTANIVNRWSPGRRFYNAYGPTETTVCATIARCTGGDESPPIGQPILNMQVYILDETLQPVSEGEKGELFIGGQGVARGYLGRHVLTEERFIPNPFSTEGGDPLYRTGDLGRIGPDGNIEYCGRIDEQINLRGYRIEPEEIEAKLTQFDSVGQGAVILHTTPSGKQQLVAYVVPENLVAELDIPALRTSLVKQLPAHMVPSTFVTLSALPLTPNGKLNRLALPAPESSDGLNNTQIEAPNTDEQVLLSKIWCDILNLKTVGVHENFYSLGGDSILSMQVISRARKSGLYLTPKKFFKHPTIYSQAGAADVVPVENNDQGMVTGSVPLTPIQQWFFKHHQADPHFYNMSIAFDVSTQVNPEYIKRTINHVLVHHDALRMKYQYTDSEWRQSNTGYEDTEFCMVVDLSSYTPEEQNERMEHRIAELHETIQIVEGSLFKAGLFLLGDDTPGRLVLVAHHLVVDGVSWQIIKEDLATAYQQIEQGAEVSLPAKTTSFQSWAQKLLNYSRSDALTSEIEGWLKRIDKGIPPLPVDFDVTTNLVASTQKLEWVLSEELTQALIQQIPRKQKTRVDDVLLAALVQSLAQWTGNNKVLVDVEGHGRASHFEHTDVSRTVGWFTNLFPLFIDLKNGSDEAATLKRVSEVMRDIPGKGLGYAVLRYLNDRATEDLASLPLAEVNFNYLGQFDRLEQPFPFTGNAVSYPTLRQSPHQLRNYHLEVVSLVANKRMHFYWMYSSQAYRQSTIEQLVSGFKDSLNKLISHSLSADTKTHSLSDFPLAGLNQDQFNTLSAILERVDGNRG